MGFSVVRFKRGNNINWGVVHNEEISPITGKFTTLADFIVKGLAKAKNLKDKPAKKTIALNKVKVVSPVTSPCQIICQGKNYFDHLIETGTKPAEKDFNLFFSKSDSAITSAHGNIKRPAGVKLLDYELELGLVIGKRIDRAENIRENHLSKYIAALVMTNDISARDIQLPQGQWFKGKSFRSFCPIGPYLYILDKEDYKKILNLKLLLTVNGQKRQEASTKQMIYKPHQTLTELSKIVNLEVGDLIMTGTPGGVALKVAKKSILEKLAKKPASKEGFIQEQLQSGGYLQDSDIIRSYIYSDDHSIDLGKQELQVIS